MSNDRAARTRAQWLDTLARYRRDLDRPGSADYVMAERGMGPAKSSVRTILVGGEPAAGIAGTRRRLEALWNARLVEFYGCTASP